MSRQLDFYVKSAIPEPYTILGVRLRPFSLGSYFLMERFDCGFIDENVERVGGIPDLLLAVAICSRTYEEFLEFVNDDDEFQRWSKQWGKAVKKQMKDKNFNMLYKFMDFENYMKEGIRVPKYFEGDEAGDGKGSGAHWTQCLLLVLTSELGYSYSEALNMPISKALADYFKWAETNGMVSLMDDDELEIVEQMEKSNGNVES